MGKRDKIGGAKEDVTEFNRGATGVKRELQQGVQNGGGKMAQKGVQQTRKHGVGKMLQHRVQNSVQQGCNGGEP